jgi:hypothetical protein
VGVLTFPTVEIDSFVEKSRIAGVALETTKFAMYSVVDRAAEWREIVLHPRQHTLRLARSSRTLNQIVDHRIPHQFRNRFSRMERWKTGLSRTRAFAADRKPLHPGICADTPSFIRGRHCRTNSSSSAVNASSSP